MISYVPKKMNIIDIHIHGIGGYDTKTSDVEHILKIAEILKSYGVSAFIPTVYPSTISSMRQNMGAIKKAMEIQEKADSIPAEKLSRIIGINLEGPFLNPKRCGALDMASLLQPSDKCLWELIDGFEDIVKIITVAPELRRAIELIRKISDAGIIVSMGHSDATYNEAEAGFRAGARGITHIFNAMRPFHQREPGIAGFGLINKDVYIELIADPFHLHAETVGLIFKLKKKERIILVSDMVKETKLENSDDARAVIDSSERLLGGCMPVTKASQKLIESGYDEHVIMNCISKNPEQYLIFSGR